MNTAFTNTADPNGEYEVVVDARADVADGIVTLDLRAADGGVLPRWEPGAHIDLILSDGLERQYSLCGDPSDRSRWRVGVLREVDGRGGSDYVHTTVQPGMTLRARGPRNHFAFAAAPRALFIAGGIGITPIRPMLREAENAGIDWMLAYAGRSRSTMAFWRELVDTYGDKVRLYPADEGARVDISGLLSSPSEGTVVYCCGPSRLIDAVEAASVSSAWPADALHRERFEAKSFGQVPVNTEFEVELSLSDEVLTVPADRTIIDVVEEAGVLVLSSCREGTCGTCETPVLGGVVDHRDSVLTPAEQADNSTMMICCSRSLSPRLILEL